MAIIALKCTQCGANITIDDKKDTGVCEHCGMSFVIEKTVNNYTINNINIIQKNNRDVNQTRNNEQKDAVETDINYIGNIAVSDSVLLKVGQCIKNEGTISAVKLVRELGGMNLAEAKTFVENFYTIDKSKPHLAELSKKQRTKQVKTNNVSAIILISCSIVLIMILCAVMSLQSKTPEKENEVITEEVIQSDYKTEISWALEKHYACAVEIDDYNGDILASGEYLFYPDAVILGTGKIPVVWDVYISNNYYNNISDLKDEEYIDYVGGVDKHEFAINLEKGQYIYIKYNPVANNDPTGYLKIKKSN